MVLIRDDLFDLSILLSLLVVNECVLFEQAYVMFLKHIVHELHSLPIEFFEVREDSVSELLPESVIDKVFERTASELSHAHRTVGVLDILEKELENAAFAEGMVALVDGLSISEEPPTERTGEEFDYFCGVDGMRLEILVHYYSQADILFIIISAEPLFSLFPE